MTIEIKDAKIDVSAGGVHTTKSYGVELGQKALLNVYIPAGADTADYTLELSYDNLATDEDQVTWFALLTSEFQVLSVAASECFSVDVNLTAGANWVRIVSSVAQTNDVTAKAAIDEVH